MGTMTTDAFEDRLLACADCPGHRPFVWPAGEQAVFRARGWPAPIRCPHHRGRRVHRGGDFSLAELSRRPTLTRACVTCGASFDVSPEEQIIIERAHGEKAAPPRRCRECRRARRLVREVS
jgi:hypothetical protein